MVMAYYKRKFSITLLKSSLLSFNELLGRYFQLFVSLQLIMLLTRKK